MARAAGSRAQSPGPGCDPYSCVPTPTACVWAWGWQPELALVVKCSQQVLDFSPSLDRTRAVLEPQRSITTPRAHSLSPRQVKRKVGGDCRWTPAGVWEGALLFPWATLLPQGQSPP